MDLGEPFPVVTRDDWVEAAGGPAAVDRLRTTTSSGLVLDPVYAPDRSDTSDDPAGYPGRSPHVRGRLAAGTGLGGWDVRALHTGADVDAVNAAVLDDLAGGATSVLIRLAGHPGGGGLTLAGVDDVDRVLRGVHLDLAPVAFEGPGAAQAAANLEAVWDRRGVPRTERRASFGIDPVAAALRGEGPTDGDGLAAAVSEASRPADDVPHVWPVAVDLDPWVAAGADDAHQLAVLLAAGAELLRAAEAVGASPGDVAGRVEARLVLGPDQFAGIALVRAARRVWDALLASCGVDGARRGLRIHAIAAERDWTRYDPFVNVLRATVVAFAAGLAGADAVTVLPHDHLAAEPTTSSRRLARNVQTILLEESSLGRVIDPAGGSWYVEDRTEALARQGWERFRAIEAGGGMLAVIADGSLAAELADAAGARRREVATRRRPVVGVSEFPHLDEPHPADRAPDPDDRLRLAAPYEGLRDAAAHNVEPTVTLATLGPLARHSARVTWMANLLGAGGVRAQPVAADEVDAPGPLVVICGDDEAYATEAAPTAHRLREAGAGEVWLAGRPGDHESAWREAGIDRFVHVGVDVLDGLRRAHELLELT